VAEVIVFHHALGLTDPVRRFAEALRNDGHTVHTPDLYGGRTFETIDAGMAPLRGDRRADGDRRPRARDRQVAAE
jgi:dienelactone hydrolase